MSAYIRIKEDVLYLSRNWLGHMHWLRWKDVQSLCKTCN